MTRSLWTALAVFGAVLVETALGYLLPGPGRYFDPFLLVVVYCALPAARPTACSRAPSRAGCRTPCSAAACWASQRLAKLLVGFVVGLAGARFLISSTAARALTVFVATLADGLLVPWLASVFTLEDAAPGAARAAARARSTRRWAASLFALVERQLQRERQERP